MVAIAVGDVADDLQTIGEHDGIADGVVDGDVVLDHAVVGVHVVDGEAGLLEAVAAEDVRASKTRVKMPSRPKRMSLSSISAPGAFQTDDAVAGIGHCRPVRPVMALSRTVASGDAMEVDAVQVAHEPVALDDGAPGAAW